MPPYGGAAAYFALTANAKATISGVGRIAIVKTRLCAALPVGVELFKQATSDFLAYRYPEGGTV